MVRTTRSIHLVLALTAAAVLHATAPARQGPEDVRPDAPVSSRADGLRLAAAERPSGPANGGQSHARAAGPGTAGEPRTIECPAAGIASADSDRVQRARTFIGGAGGEARVPRDVLTAACDEPDISAGTMEPRHRAADRRGHGEPTMDPGSP